MFPKVICILTIAISAFAVRHEMTLYSDYNQQTESVTFTSKQQNLTLWQHFLNTAVIACVSPQGWAAFQDVDFETQLVWIGIGCNNLSSSLATAYSMRHFGPPDTLTEAIALYNGTRGNTAGGYEWIIESPAANDFAFTPKFFVLTGYTNWTVYSENNFSGNSKCLNGGRSDYVQFFGTDIEFAVASLAKGCDVM